MFTAAIFPFVILYWVKNYVYHIKRKAVKNKKSKVRVAGRRAETSKGGGEKNSHTVKRASTYSDAASCWKPSGVCPPCVGGMLFRDGTAFPELLPFFYNANNS